MRERVHVCVRPCIYFYACILMCVCMYVCIVRVYARVYVRMYVCMYTCTHVCNIRMYVSICVCEQEHSQADTGMVTGYVFLVKTYKTLLRHRDAYFGLRA